MRRSFQAEQRRVAAGMAIAAALTLATMLFGVALLAAYVPPLPTVADRIGYALRCDLLLAVPLAMSVGNVARLRFLSADDIAGAAFTRASERVAIGNAILQNTVEQAILAILVHIGLAVSVEGAMALIPALVALFCFGRLFFALGYRRGAGARAFGFALTFFPSLAALVLGLFHLFD